MRIQKSKFNKGHGGPVFPDWLGYMVFVGLLTMLSGFSLAVIVVIRLAGFPLAYNTWGLVFILDLLIVLTFIAYERYEDWKLERQWKNVEIKYQNLKIGNTKE